jgi:hypothetical protein
MPSRLAALKAHIGKKSSSPSPLRHATLPGVGYIQNAANTRSLERSNTSVSTSSSATAVSSGQVPEDKVVLQLAAGAELPSVPYKLRFALSPQEWDERLEVIARHRAHSAQPYWEILWFLLVFGIPGTAVYPLYTTLLSSVTGADGRNVVSRGQDPTATASVITIGVVILLAMLLATPLFLRKYIVQRRLNKYVNRWAATDRRQTDEPDPDVVRWKVRLPNIFRTACDIDIPVPPRKRSISLEAALEKDRIVSLVSLAATDEKGAATLSRVGSIASERSMFDD